MDELGLAELHQVVAGTAEILDHLRIDYAIMGGAAVYLLDSTLTHHTADVDLVIRVDERNISADALCQILLQSYGDVFAPVNQYGHYIPAYRLSSGGNGSAPKLAEIEVFDYLRWPDRPQYNLQTASQLTLTVLGRPVKIFSPAWLLREKILTQYQRRGNLKAQSDVIDIYALKRYASCGQPEMNFDENEQLQDALRFLLQHQPSLATSLRRLIKCAAVFGNWYVTV